MRTLQGVSEQRQAGEALRAVRSRADRPLTDYTGTYEASLWGDIHLRLHGEALTPQVAGGASADLSYRDHDTFHVTGSDPVLREYFFGTLATFGAADDGRVSRLSMTLNRDSIEVTRRS